jgi:para-aminobenzoate synthetase component I
VIDYTIAGDIFQANVGRSWQVELGSGDHPFALRRRLSAAGEAPHAAYLRLPGAAIVSNSPERLLSVGPEGAALVARTSPIKGTRPRFADRAADEASKSELLASEKDRAENLMIVDLVRNDLSRVAAKGGVSAGPLFQLETYASVHHLVSVVTARLAKGRDALDAFAAMFPGGSISGAPKIRAEEIIAELEGEPRNEWCGSMFWLGEDGAFDASILIRTMAFHETEGGWHGTLRAGAGVTVASVPDEEVKEMNLKASLFIQEITRGTARSAS